MFAPSSRSLGSPHLATIALLLALVAATVLGGCAGPVTAPEVAGEAVPAEGEGDGTGDAGASDAAAGTGDEAAEAPSSSGGLSLTGGPELPPVPAPPWETAVLTEHPLVGRVWSVAEADFVEPETALYRLAEADFVMLGEKHDNPDHHRLQTWLVEAMLALGRKPAVAFEQITEDKEGALYDHLTLAPGDAAGIAEAVGWAETSWPEWSMYQPIAQAALDAEAPLLAANPADALVQGIAGMGAPPEPEDRARLGLDDPLPEALQAALEQEIVDSHCGYLPAEMAPPMADAQRARDGGMAERIVRAATELPLDGAFLITGNGHARADRGVPLQIARLAPASTTAAAGILEVVEGRDEPTAYAEDYDGALPFDYLFFTPRLDDIDPCEKFAEQLRQMGGGGNAEGEATEEEDGDSDGG